MMGDALSFEASASMCGRAASSRVNAPCSWNQENWAALARPWALEAPKRMERKMLARKVT